MENNIENLIPEEQLLKFTEAITQAVEKLTEAVQIMTSAACDTLNSIDWEQLERVIDEAKANALNNDHCRIKRSGCRTDWEGFCAERYECPYYHRSDRLENGLQIIDDTCIFQGENSNDTEQNTLSGNDTDKPED